MSCNHTNVFNNVTSVGDNYLINQLEDNIKTFLDYGFLNIGGFINIDIPTSGLYGGSLHILKPTTQPGYQPGQVWQAFKKDWVYETGISYNTYSPTIISGVHLNNTFYPAPTGSGNISYTINYPLGHIIFNKGLPSTSNVQLEYSYRWCQVYKSSSTQWKELQELSYKPNPQLNYTQSGDYNIYAGNRIQMPAIVVEPIARSFSKPYQLGASDFAIDQDILLHIFTENKSDNNRIVDIVRLQKDKTILLYDTNKVAKSGVYSLNYNGSLNSNRICYSELLVNYYWNKCYFKEISVLNMESSNQNLFWCTVRVTSEVII
jgi:hypothetical protein